MVRHAILKVSFEIIINMCIHGVPKPVSVENALPKDTTFVRAGHDQTGQLFLVLQSDEFDEVEVNGLIPTIDSPIFNNG